MSESGPRTNIELFSDEMLRDPYEHYRVLRGLGELVWLDRYEAWIVTGYAAARSVLQKWRDFSSSAGVGLNQAVNNMGRDSVIMSDPPRHTALRGVLMDRLSPRSLQQTAEPIRRQANELVGRLVSQGSFDAVQDLARLFPVSVVGDLIGIPEEGRSELLEVADGTFNSFGPDNDRARLGMGAWIELGQLLQRLGSRNNLQPGSLGEAIYEAADAGDIAAEDCLTMLGTYINAGMDTTVNAIGSAVYLLASQPVQWQRLSTLRDSAAAAFEEVLRVESPLQYLTRLASVEHRIGDVVIAKGQRVIVCYGAANRDPDRWERPDDFLIDRPQLSHLAFGFGIHSCAGAALARIEGQAVLEALATCVERITLEAAPEWRLHNVIRGLTTLPVTVKSKI